MTALSVSLRQLVPRRTSLTLAWSPPTAGFMGELVPPNRKALAVYPLFLFYTAIGWLILIAAKRG